jgi:cell division protein FtsZ
MELEQRLTGAKSKAEEFEPKIIEDELVFEKKTIAPSAAPIATKADPTDRPIDEILKERADERRRKLKDFNYRFQHNRSSIDEIEKEPAYKRQGVDLSKNQEPDSKVSRTTLGEDSNEELRLRTNNSFLHDNVD